MMRWGLPEGKRAKYGVETEIEGDILEKKKSSREKKERSRRRQGVQWK